jgi:hypothetical protein
VAAASGDLGFNGSFNPNGVGVGINTTDTAGAATATPPVDQPVTTQPASTIAPPPSSLNPAAPAGTDWYAPDPLAAGGALKADTATGGGGTLSDIMGFVQKNPMLAYGALQAGGQFLSGLTSTITPAQVSALNAQAAANQAAANLTAQQTANLAGPKPVATLAPVTGTPNPILTPPTAGIINAAPRVNVTGAPA